MKTILRNRGLAWGTFAIAGILGMSGCGPAAAGGMDDAPATKDFARVVNVEVSELHPQTFVDEIRVTAVALANRDVRVAAEESGVITRILVDKGRRVRAGEAIAKIDDTVLRAQVDQAQAQADLAAQTWERRKRLWEQDKVGSEIAYLEAKYAQQQTAANLAALRARLERTTIRAPFGGILDDRSIEVGTMVAPGQTVARVVDLNRVKIDGGVPERYAADIHVGTQALVSFDVLPGKDFPAKLDYVGAAVNTENRTFPVEMVLPNEEGLIKPEMVANVSITRNRLENALVVPQDALVRVEKGYVVFVAVDGSEGTLAEQRDVTLGPSRDNTVVIDAGVSAGDRLIVVGQKTVAAGDHVSIVGTRSQGTP
ncbi:MAG: efflux RND transporter periplasmic adaptor subunit [Gemmatimonadetes bacterium]|nr:efflux RND transporter periplasmic adaptor subunit [Gemmatimonadota bacterium]